MDGHTGCEISDLDKVATPFVVKERLQTFWALQLMTERLELTDAGRKYLGIIRVIESLRRGENVEKERVQREQDKYQRLLKILWLRGTSEILQYLADHGKSQYSELKPFASTYTLNTRLGQLLEYGILEHHFEKTKRTKEWYEITEKGRKVLESMKVLKNAVEGE